MSGENPQTDKDWALLACAQWGRAEHFPGLAFTELVEILTLMAKGVREQEKARVQEACAKIGDGVGGWVINGGHIAAKRIRKAAL